MSVAYHEPLAEILLRANAIAGVTGATIETNLTTRPLTAAQTKGATFTFTAGKKALLYAEQRLARAIARTKGHPWRAFLRGVTASLANEAALPSLDSLSRPILGVFGAAYDASDGTQMTEKSLAEVRRLSRNAGTWRKCPVYHFNLDGGRAYHTRTSIVLECCVYDRAAQWTAIGANSNMLLPDGLEEALFSGGVSYLFRDDALAAQAKDYRSYFAETEADIKAYVHE
jgi:hypothetical protein